MLQLDRLSRVCYRPALSSYANKLYGRWLHPRQFWDELAETLKAAGLMTSPTKAGPSSTITMLSRRATGSCRALHMTCRFRADAPPISQYPRQHYGAV